MRWRSNQRKRNQPSSPTLHETGATSDHANDGAGPKIARCNPPSAHLSIGSFCFPPVCSAPGARLFDMATVAKLLDQHQSAERDHSAALWSLSMFEAFLRQVHGCSTRAETRPDNVASVV